MTTGGRMGGAERLIADVARAAKRSGSDVEVCVLGRRDDLGVELAADGIIVHELGLARAVGAPAVLLALARLVRRRRYDVVHTHLIHASAIGLAAARLGGVPLVVMTRHYERYAWLYGTRLDRMLQRAANAMAHHIFAISDAARETMVRLEGVTPDRISVVPNGIDLERVRSRAVAPAQVDLPHGPIVGTVGSLERRKGHEYLVEAVSLVAGEHAPMLLVVGDGPERPALERLVERLGMRDRVRFAGYHADPYPLMARMDVYAQPSVEEGFGISVLEAMALDRPVIAAATGGLPEIVRDGANGLLVPPRDAPALAKAIERLMSDPDLRRRLVANAREVVTERYDAEGTAARYADAYERLLRDRALTA